MKNARTRRQRWLIIQDEPESNNHSGGRSSPSSFMFAGGWIRGAITKFFNPQQELTNEVVVKQLEKIQDLTTAKETDYGFEKYEDGGIAFLNKKQFTMFYTYEVRAGGRSGQGPDKKSTRTPKQCLSRYLHRKIQSVAVNPRFTAFL